MVTDTSNPAQKSPTPIGVNTRSETHVDFGFYLRGHTILLEELLHHANHLHSTAMIRYKVDTAVNLKGWLDTR